MATSKPTRHRRREANAYEKLRPTNPDWLNLESKSLVEISGIHRSNCGYCKAVVNTSVSYGLFAKRLTCADYQELIDRGWRRSGTYIYKPIMHETCCPQYTIRLDVSRFKPNKGQRQLLNRLRRYLNSDHTTPTNSSGESGRRKSNGQGVPPAAAAVTPESSNGRKPKTGARFGSHKGGGNSPKKNSANNGDRWRDSQSLRERSSAQVTAAAIAAVEDCALNGVELMPGWRSEVEGWSRARPIRNIKHGRVSGEAGGLCTTVALNIASAARKRGWKGAGSAGGAMAIAEAVASRMREGSGAAGQMEDEGKGGVLMSNVTVAPNGFINFVVAEVESSSEANQPAIMPQPPPSQSARPSATNGGESPTPPSTPPPPLDLAQTPDDSGKPFNGDAPDDRAPGKGLNVPPIAVVAEGASRATAGADKSREATRDGAAVEGMEVDASIDRIAGGESADVPSVGLPVGMTGGVAEAAAASMDWSERQESFVDEMETEDPSLQVGADPTGPSTGLSSLPPLDPGLKSHRLTVTTVPARVTDEVFSLYLKYQVSVHGDEPLDVTPVSFRRFLVDSPLLRESLDGAIEGAQGPARRKADNLSDPPVDDRYMQEGGGAEVESAKETEGRDSLAVPCGSYHQLYRIDGRLVAVGVVDILPKCLSSVYCFYDPDYRALALGKLTALMETEFVREAGSLRPSLRDYYMGFYIHTCPKMSYKGSYAPSFLLCPERLSWVPLELCRPVLDTRKYARLSYLLDPPPKASSRALDFGAGSPHGTVSGERCFDEGAPESSRAASSSSSQHDMKADSRQRPREPNEGAHKNEAAFSHRSSSGGSTSTEHGATGQRCRRGRTPGGDASRGRGERNGAYRPNDDGSVEEAEVDPDVASGMNDVPLLLGQPPFPVSMAVLTQQAKEFVRNLLRTYMATMGPALAKRVLLKLYG